MPSTYRLDPRLEADSVPVIELPLSSVRLSRDANYPWLIVVPRLPDLADLTDLTDYDRRWAMDEVARVGWALQAETGAHKLNIANLGNMVRQLHIHVIARFETDPAWPGPVWGKLPSRPYEPAAEADLVARLRGRLQD